MSSGVGAAECGRARALSRKGRHREALEILRNALGFSVDREILLAAMGECVDRAGSREERRWVRDIIEHGTPGLATEVGAFCCWRGRLSEAGELLKKAVAAPESSAGAYVLLAGVEQLRGRVSEAVRTIAAGLKRHPSDSGLLFRLARLSELLGDAKGMKRQFRRFLKTEPSAMSARFQALMALDDFSGAFREAERLLDSWDPNEAESLTAPWDDEIEHARSEGYYRERLRRLRAFRGRGVSVWLRFFKGLLLFQLKDYPGALEEFRGLRRFSPRRYGWMRCCSGLARLWMDDGSLKLAEEDFRAALRSRPDALWARGRLAETLLCRGRAREAFAEFDRAEEMIISERLKAPVWAWRGELLLWSGRYRQACRELDRAVRAGSGLALCWRGAARMLLMEYAGAREDLDGAVRLDPADAEAFLWRGELGRRTRRLREASADLGRSIESGVGEWARVNRALVRAACGDIRGMREDLRRLPGSMAAHMGPAPQGESAEIIKERLQGLLRAARGIRRSEAHLRRLWSKKRTKVR